MPFALHAGYIDARVLQGDTPPPTPPGMIHMLAGQHHAHPQHVCTKGSPSHHASPHSSAHLTLTQPCRILQACIVHHQQLQLCSPLPLILVPLLPLRSACLVLVVCRHLPPLWMSMAIRVWGVCARLVLRFKTDPVSTGAYQRAHRLESVTHGLARGRVHTRTHVQVQMHSLACIHALVRAKPDRLVLASIGEYLIVAHDLHAVCQLRVPRAFPSLISSCT